MERLGQFRILSKIGEGGMGAVYRARDEQLQRDVAIKLLPESNPADLTGKARLLREARAAAGLSHPNICVVHEVGEESGQAYIAMECVDGEPLDERIAREPLPVSETLRFAIQIADALAHAHERGIVHRDLKPSNIIITPDGRVKVLDFGLAKRLIETSSVDSVTDVMVTMAGAITGTPAYMAPEQLRGLKADARGDLWSVGVILYEMVTGKRPFGGKTLAEVSAAILASKQPPLPSHVPNELAAIVGRCLEKDPANRYQSAAELRSALDLVQRTAGTTAPRNVRLPWIAASLAVLMIVALFANRSRVAEWLTPSPAQKSANVTATPPVEGRPPAVAVLPFSNFSGAEADYLADGMQDAVIGGLARVKDLRVLSQVSTLSLKKSGKSAIEISKILGVDNLVEGSVAQRGDRIRIEVKLIRTVPEERQVWSEVYERDMRDLLSVYGEIASAVSAQIDSRLVPAAKAAQAEASRQIDPEVYKLYLRGMYQVHKGGNEGFENGMALLRQAIEKDPADPLPYAGLSQAYALRVHDGLGKPEDLEFAKAAAHKAASGNSTIAESYAAIALMNLYDDWDWNSAGTNFRRALDLNSSLAEIRRQYSWYLIAFKNGDEALTEMIRARDTEPIDGIYYADIAWQEEILGRDAEALENARKGAELSPQNDYVVYVLGLLQARNGKFNDAIETDRRLVRISPGYSFALAHTLILAGRPAEAQPIIDNLKKKTDADSAFGLAEIYCAKGDKDEAMRWTEIARAKHHIWTPWFGVFAEFAPLRGDPRFEKFLASMKVPNVEPGWPRRKPA